MTRQRPDGSDWVVTQDGRDESDERDESDGTLSGLSWGSCWSWIWRTKELQVPAKPIWNAQQAPDRNSERLCKRTRSRYPATPLRFQLIERNRGQDGQRGRPRTGRRMRNLGLRHNAETRSSRGPHFGHAAVTDNDGRP